MFQARVLQTKVETSESKFKKIEASENLFSEHDNFTISMSKNETSMTDDNASCTSSHNQRPELYMQDAQTWSDFDDDVSQETSKIQKQYTNTYVQTDSFEIDENTRQNNLMFCKFVSHELDNCIGNERYEKMQKILEVFKK